MENAEDALRCARCGLAFSVVNDTGETIMGGPAAPEAKPTAKNPATASAVMTPPPAPANFSNFGAGFSQPTYGLGSMHLEPGSDFGPRYRIESKLGEGGMGTVYKAFDRDLDRVVALKLLRPEMVADPNALARFKQELLLASKISQKNILRIHDLGDLGGLKFISMAFVEGEDLRGLLNREGKLSIERTVTIVKQLCAALEAAQSEGVVHRDLKPHNVMVDKSGNIFVSDFGLAKSLEAGAIGMTRTNEFLGTPRYMSPEQVEGGNIDHRSDLYSLGLIIYEMVTGDVPFTGDSTLQVMFKRVKEPPKDPRKLRPDLPDYLARIILKLLEKDPAKRYQSARELLQDLETQHAPSVSMRLPVFTLEGRNLLIAGAALAAILLIGGTVYYFKSGGTGSETTATAADSRFVAVLPFTHGQDAENLSYIASGLADGLMGRLGQLSNLRLASRSAVEQVKVTDSVQKIGRSLGVSLLIRGSVQTTATGIRVLMSLENVQTGARQWTREFAGTASDSLGLEDQIYSELLTALSVKPSNEELVRGTSHPTENLEAYDYYLRGRNELRRAKDAKGWEESVNLFDTALKKDANFALAYAGLADSYLRLYRDKKDVMLAQRAQGAAEQAIRIDPNLAEAHFSLGSVLNAQGRSNEAIAAIRQALQFAPNSDDGYRRLGNSLFLSGRKDDAIAAYQKAIDINPFYWMNYNVLGDAYLQSGEFEKAGAAFRKVTELEPENPAGHENLGVMYFMQGKYEECIPAFQKAIQLQPFYGTYSNLGTAFFYLKRYAESVKMFEKAVELNPNQSIAVGNLADALRWAQQQDSAKVTYDRAITLGVQELRVNPRNASTMGYLALYYAKKGDAVRGMEFIRRARSIEKNDATLAYQEAVVQLIAGKQKESLAALREALQQGYPLKEVESDPEMNALRSTAEYSALASGFAAKK